MSFKQKNTPLQQYAGVPLDLKAIQANATANTAVQYGLSKGLTGEQAFKDASSAPKDYASLVQRQNAFNDAQNAAKLANSVPSANPSSMAVGAAGLGNNLFMPGIANARGNGPQSTIQNNTSGWNRMDSHNTSAIARANNGNPVNNATDIRMQNRSAMFSPLTQLKKEQMEYNKISPKAFTNSGTIERMMGKAVPNSPFMQMVDPLTGLALDPTMSQDPNAPAPINTGTPMPPPVGVQTPTTPIYGINQ